MESSPQSKNEAKQAKRFKNKRELFWYAFMRIRETRKWWLIPVLVLLVIGGFFLNLFIGYNVLPAIYSLIP